MSTVCCAPAEQADSVDDIDAPWWKDRAVLIPVASSVAFLAGLICEWSGVDTAALVLFWAGLLLGASTFVPGALRQLFTKGKVGIGLLMTISAVGAVILGYVEEAAALAFLYSIAEALEDKAMDRARSGLRALLKLVPETATVLQDDATRDVPASGLQIGQTLLVRPGERVATDGFVRRGRSSLDTSAITGESIPVEVAPGDEVLAGSINTSGVLEVEAIAAGTDNSLTTIVELVEHGLCQGMWTVPTSFPSLLRPPGRGLQRRRGDRSKLVPVSGSSALSGADGGCRTPRCTQPPPAGLDRGSRRLAGSTSRSSKWRRTIRPPRCPSTPLSDPSTGKPRSHCNNG